MSRRLAALRHRDFALFWGSNVFSRIGTQMCDVALSWHVYLLTHSALALGLIGAARVAPIVLLALGGGVAADTFDRRRIMMVTQTVMAISSAALSITTRTGHISVALLYVSLAVSGAAVAFDSPARQTLLVNLLPREDLENGLSLNVMGFQIATSFGPMLGGWLIGRTGLENIYAIDALSFAAVLFAVSIVRPRADVTAPHTGPVQAASLREGFTFLRKTPILIWLMLADFIATFFAGSTRLMPIFANDVFRVGPEGLGVLLAAYPLGALACSTVVTLRRPIRAQGVTVLGAIAVYGAAIAAFGAAPYFAFALAMQALAGAADTVSTVVRQVVRQTSTPDELRGRMTGMNMMFFIGGPQLGEVEAGAVAQALGPRISVIAGGLACVVAAGVIAVISPPLRSLRLPKGEPAV